jgi:hypothetical protein
LSISAVTLIFGDTTFLVVHQSLIANCGLFANNTAFTASLYRVRSLVPLDIFQQFLKATKDKAVKVINQNVSELWQLYADFGFRSLFSMLSSFRSSSSFRNSANAEARSRISALEERVLQQKRRLVLLEAEQSRFAELPAELARMQTNFTCLTYNV